MKPLDETDVLRFASGEMDADEESTFLARCEIASDSWREVVLAVAEHHRLVELLGEMAASDKEPQLAARRTKQELGRRLRSVSMTAAAALVAGLLLGIIGTRMASSFHGRDAQVVTAPQAVQPPPRLRATA